MNDTKDQTSSLNQQLCRSSTYNVDGKRFIVTPVFRQNSKETLGSVLLKLMRTEAIKR